MSDKSRSFVTQALTVAFGSGGSIFTH